MNSPEPAPRQTLLAIDGNSLTHRAYHAFSDTRLHDDHGRPIWAIKGFWNLLLATIDRIGPDAVVVGFDDPHDSRRRTRFPEYKAHRKAKEPELVTQLAMLPPLLEAAGLHVVTPSGLEADDVTAAAARDAGTAGWDCVIATSDRDAFAHISATTSVLRVINGGIDNSPILTPSRLHTMVGIAPHQYLDYAAMRGDASDNLGGIRGIGEKTAAALLSGFVSMAEVWADLEHNDGAGVQQAAGKAALTKLRAEDARSSWERNRLLMSPATSVTLTAYGRTAMPGSLPLEADRVRSALEGAGLGLLSPAALNRLCPTEAAMPSTTSVWGPVPPPDPGFGQEPPPWDDSAAPTSLGPAPVAIDATVSSTPPAPTAVPEQEALF